MPHDSIKIFYSSCPSYPIKSPRPKIFFNPVVNIFLQPEVNAGYDDCLASMAIHSSINYNSSEGDITNMQLRLKIVTPEKLIYDSEVSGVNVSTELGQIGILPHHANLMAKLTPGELIIKKNGKTEVMAIGDGFLQVSQNTATVMTDLATYAVDIDEKAVEEARKRAEQALEQTLSDEEYAETLANLEKSLVQLRVKRRHKVR